MSELTLMRRDANVTLSFLTMEYAIILSAGLKSAIMMDLTVISLIVMILYVKYLICLMTIASMNIVIKRDVITTTMISVFLTVNVILMLSEMEFVISTVIHLIARVMEEIVLSITVNAHLI